MGFLQILFLNLAFLVIIASKSSLSVVNPPNFPIAKPGCADRCGSVSIPYPFGTTEDCYHSPDFLVTCTQTSNSSKAFLEDSTIEITDISLDGQLKVLQFVAQDCYDRNGRNVSSSEPWTYLATYTANNTANKFTIIGCDAYGYIYGNRLIEQAYMTGCTAMCYELNDLIKGSCTGLGCCQSAIPPEVWSVNLMLGSYFNYKNVSSFNNCSYAFLVEESAFTFYPENLTNFGNVEKLPMVVDWAIGNGTCEEAKMNASSYACKSEKSMCVNKTNEGYGYRCFCLEGYQGNPYLSYGCQDVNEC